ncbi:hypothetical protein P5673_019712 [Acropora cervicornis]|uniref:Uncharacterized protein n=1 Tax=Acropora cervicornis TaxID=6130 RepID=A0AAD9QB83_ACRCE|nr:hypothetical protein P5673_019712 [Acropora cervicornis]
MASSTSTQVTKAPCEAKAAMLVVLRQRLSDSSVVVCIRKFSNISQAAASSGRQEEGMRFILTSLTDGLTERITCLRPNSIRYSFKESGSSIEFTEFSTVRITVSECPRSSCFSSNSVRESRENDPFVLSESISMSYGSALFDEASAKVQKHFVVPQFVASAIEGMTKYTP